jgi:hypothetical protein
MDDGYHQRQLTDTRNLQDLVTWLEYGKTSGYVAARCSKQQEEHWGMLLKQVFRVLGVTQGRLLTEQDRIQDGSATLEHYRRLVLDLADLNYKVLKNEYQESPK